MAWTYDTSLATQRDTVRLLVGDTISTDPQMSDEELDALLLVHGSVKATAINVALALAAKYARFADKWVGDLKILASQKSRAYYELAKQLGSSRGFSGGVPSAGGIYTSDKEATEGDEGLVKPHFRRGFMDNEEGE